tara:strand:+ start:740 stop:1030 length:291 start_codon:yes stop_codon:yes gene_type:complete
MTFVENGDVFNERWTLHCMVRDRFDSDMLEKLANAEAGFVYDTGWKYPQVAHIEATDEFYVESQEETERECHHLDWWDLKHPEEVQFGFDPNEYEW